MYFSKNVAWQIACNVTNLNINCHKCKNNILSQLQTQHIVTIKNMQKSNCTSGKKLDVFFACVFQKLARTKDKIKTQHAKQTTHNTQNKQHTKNKQYFQNKSKRLSNTLKKHTQNINFKSVSKNLKTNWQRKTNWHRKTKPKRSDGKK